MRLEKLTLLASLLLAPPMTRAADAPASPPAGPAAADPDGVKFFESKIRPVLVEQCYKCHSSTSEKLKGGLRLDSRPGLLRGGDSGKPAVVPGDAEHSLLLVAIHFKDQDLQMPPKHELPAAQVADFDEWVRMGAPDPRAEAPAVAAGATPGSVPPVPPADSPQARGFWSFRPPDSPAVPAVRDAAWPKTDIDRFILARLEARGIAPVGRADRHTLIRRATFDLTGLPPTPAEVEAFVSDRAPDAFARVVDRLLASPAYGECWGRHWLDLARYADTGGESADYPIPTAYRYRNWVIDAFNRDQPYDQFLREQIAGDLLSATDEADRESKVIATGYLAISKRFSVSPENEMHLTIDDTIDTLGRSVLGLTIGCARCHDHKFDPIPTTDYYALYGIFAGTRYPMPGSEMSQYAKDMAMLASEEEAAVLRPLQDRIDEVDARYRKLRSREPLAATDAEAAQIRADLAATKKELAPLLAQVPQEKMVFAVSEGTPGDAPVLRRGEPLNKGEVVRRGFLTVLGGQKLAPSENGSGRIQLAQWLTDPKNPLTARVMVNRVWQHHFGRGIVRTPSDFGVRGAAPTNPELLDWLAVRFMQGGWSVKSMHRLVMMSEAYQLADTVEPKAMQADPANDLGWHFERRRLQAEEVRDSMLAVSGGLDRSMAGPHPFPPPSQWHWTQHNAFSAVYDSNHRSVYLMVQRLKRHPFFGTFDGADPNATTAERAASTSPLQALFMMNDRFVYEQSAAFARRLTADAPDDAGRIDLAYRRVFGRAPEPEESAAAVSYLRQYRGQAAREGKPDDALASLARVLFGSNEFMFVE